MQPLLIASKIILDIDDRPIGVLVVESDKRDAFTEDQLKGLMDSAAKDAAILLSPLRKYLPTMQFAQGEGL